LLNMRLKRALNLSIQDWLTAFSGSSSYTSCLCSAASGTAFRNREQKSGITVMATTNEASNERQNARANAEKRNLETPYRKTTGKKSTTSTKIPASTSRL